MSLKNFDVPLVDMSIVSKSSKIQRQYIRNFIPKIGLSTVNYKALNNIENFYTDCQNFRDYYRDPKSRMMKPPIFKFYYGDCRVMPSTLADELKQPPYRVREKMPIFYPIERFGDQNMFGVPSFRGTYDLQICAKFKR